MTYPVERKTLEERLLSNKYIDPITECWIYLGGTNGDGYGWMEYNNRPYTTNRLSAYLYLGLDLNNPKELACHNDSKCKRKDCFNPDHLYIGDKTSNMRDKSKSITHCPQGHEYSKENTRMYKGRRNCRICQRDAKQRWKERQIVI
jgi:hypothetical protein